MGLTFEVDGKVFPNPTARDIESGFALIDSEGPRSISEISIFREPVTLIAFGHPKEGYTLQIETALPKAPLRCSMTKDHHIQQQQVIETFQAFARNNENWPTNFQWEELEGPVPTRIIARRMIIYIVCFVIFYAVLKYVLKIF